MLSPETILQQRYRIVRQLGQGGMGAVYEAVDERLDTIVALKETLFTDEKLRKQFEREARLLARLHHPALPRVSDHFTEGEGQFLVMQYIAGEDLAEMLQAHKAAFPPEQVLRWADQLCDALDYLHTQDPQVIHRDIKPQNLKLTARGQIVLLDFGLAKGSAGQMSVVTSSASIFGYTPNYAPLEQVQGLGTDARSDIYSLAATLYHLMTNVKPPDALSRAAAIVNGQIDPLSPANRVAPQVSPSVASVLSKGMSQNRAERYASAEEMRETLRAAASDQLNKAVPVGGTDASAKTVSLEARTRLVGASTQVEAGEAQTLVARDTTNVQTKALESERAKVVPTRSSRAWLAAVVLLVLIGGGSAAFFAYRAHKNAAKNNAGSVNPTESPKAEAQTATTQVNSVRVEPKASPQSTAEKTARPETSSQRANASKSAARRASEQTNITREATEAAEKAIHETERSGERGRDQSVRRPPDTPRYDPFRNQPGHPPGTGQIPEVRTLPNGTKVIRQPDGIRIVIMPNGSTRVYPPINRRQKRNP